MLRVSDTTQCLSEWSICDLVQHLLRICEQFDFFAFSSALVSKLRVHSDCFCKEAYATWAVWRRWEGCERAMLQSLKCETCWRTRVFSNIQRHFFAISSLLKANLLKCCFQQSTLFVFCLVLLLNFGLYYMNLLKYIFICSKNQAMYG